MDHNFFTIVGLENEAGRGRFTRHAVGARFVDLVHERFGFEPWQSLGDAVFSFGMVRGKRIRLLKQTEGKLHNCGYVLVSHLVDHVDLARVIVAYDEAGYPIGDGDFKPVGIGDNGHMGLKNMNKELADDRYARVAIGIGTIPQEKDLWEDFFNANLSPDKQTQTSKVFETLLESLCAYIAAYQEQVLQHPKDFHGPFIYVPENIRLDVQLAGRRKNLALSPLAVPITKEHARRVNLAVTLLTRTIAEVASRYARLTDTPDHPLVRLLESGIPAEMHELVRRSKSTVDGMSFDFHSGKLLEINAAPMPSFWAGAVRQKMDLDGPGEFLTIEMLTAHVAHLVKTARKAGLAGRVKLVNRIGEVEIGATGWLSAVAADLESLGIDVVIGDRSLDDDIVWANLTWMTPERWPSVVLPDDKDSMRIFPSPRNFLFTSKRFLVALSRIDERRILGIPEGRDADLDDIIPWTGTTDEDAHTVRFLLRMGKQVYAKPYLSSGGRGGVIVSRFGHLREAHTPAIVQEWVPPYVLGNTGYFHDIRVIVYGQNSTHRVWLSRVWENSATLMHPLDAPVVYS